MLPSETEVLIVGAGPAGLTLALSLARAGVPHLLVDLLEAGLNTSRAGVIHAHTLEALDGLGAAGPLADRGLRLTRFSLRNRDRAIATLDFLRLASPHPCILMLPQDETEAVLAERLALAGGQVWRGYEAAVFAADAGGATVRLRGPEGEETVRARFVAGADGMHSAVRGAAGVGFPGGTYALSFVLADVRMDWPMPQEVTLHMGAEGPLVVAPLPGGRYRVVAARDPAPEHPVTADIQAILDARGLRGGDVGVRETLWSSRFRVHRRLAERFRSGPFVLLGDAAHVHSPAGGQGMNCGLIDAATLGPALARALAGDDTAPDAWAAARRAAASEVLALAGRMTAMATLRPGPAAALRDAGLTLASRVPAVRSRALAALSGTARRGYTRLAA